TPYRAGATNYGSPFDNLYPWSGMVRVTDAVAGLELVIYPTSSGGSETTYSADLWYFNASYPCLFFGGVYSRHGDFGLFCVYYTNASYSYADIGCRLQKLP
uniref:hypothetical protein n=1 Tax=Dysosmobacter welbionis TaxID=2093857 RepID=UPI003A95C874